MTGSKREQKIICKPVPKDVMEAVSMERVPTLREMPLRASNSCRLFLRRIPLHSDASSLPKTEKKPRKE